MDGGFGGMLSLVCDVGLFQHDYVGSFALNDVATEQFKRRVVSPPTGKSGDEFELYIENVSGQSLDS